MIPRGLSIFLSYKLLVPLSRRSSQCPVYGFSRLQCLPTLTYCMEKNQPSLDLSRVPLAEPGKAAARICGVVGGCSSQGCEGRDENMVPTGLSASGSQRLSPSLWEVRRLFRRGLQRPFKNTNIYISTHNGLKFTLMK